MTTRQWDVTRRPWVVVIGWLIGNLVLVGILFGFSSNPVPEYLYLAAGAPLLVFAATVALVNRGRRTPQEYVRLPAGSGYTGVIALGLFLCGLGWIFANWLAIVGAVVVIGAVYALYRLPHAVAPRPAEDRAASEEHE